VYQLVKLVCFKKKSGVLNKPPLPEIEGTGKDENETKKETHDFLHSLNQINLSNLILNEYF
jgi:hypothetical protein